VVATGAPFAGAAISVTDRTGTLVGAGVADAIGFFRISPNPLYKSPLVISASRTNPAGGKDTLVSMTDTTTSTTANVNTISNMVAAMMSASGDPATLASDLATGKVTFDETAILLNWSKVKSIMQPLLDALKISMDHVRAGPAPANGTGVDQLLDSLDVTIARNSNGTSTIEITIKTGGDGQQPPVIRFVNTTLLEGILQANGITPTQVQNRTITAASLPAPGISAQIADLLGRMTACFALPTATRVSSTSGTAANVTAPECQTIFKDNNPATYRQNGTIVSAGSALPTLFSDSGTGTGFGQGSFDYKRDNGDIVFSFVSVDKNLVARNDESVATAGADGKLRLVGNQYQFAGSVNAMEEIHSFIDITEQSYFSTGYTFKVPLQGVLQNKVVRVDVTSPRGTTYTLVPGTDAMVLPIRDSNFIPELDDNGNPAPSGSAFVRLASSGLFATTGPFTAASPARTLERNVYSLKTSETAEMIAAYPPRGVWTFAYFQTGATTPVATQTVRTRARAMTLDEFTSATVVEGSALFDSKSLAALRARQNPQVPALTPFLIPLSGLPSTAYAWSPFLSKSGNQLLPVSIRVFGFVFNQGAIPPYQDFSDFLSLSPTARSATIPCTNASNAVHCDAQGAYAANAWLEGAQLLAREASGREFGVVTSAWRFSN
jgi:hypothetical protein